MTTPVPTLELSTRRQWRAWLAKQPASSPGVWLVFHKNRTRVKCIEYEESVREALCFGCIDSLIKRLDDDRYARKFTLRKPSSKWSESNRKRWAELKAAGLLAPAGLTAAPTRNTYAARPEIPEMPPYFAEALQGNPKARSFYQGLARSDQRPFVIWVHTAKRPETRERRLREAVRLLAAGKKLGLK